MLELMLIKLYKPSSLLKHYPRRSLNFPTIVKRPLPSIKLRDERTDDWRVFKRTMWVLFILNINQTICFSILFDLSTMWKFKNIVNYCWNNWFMSWNSFNSGVGLDLISSSPRNGLFFIHISYKMTPKDL